MKKWYKMATRSVLNFFVDELKIMMASSLVSLTLSAEAMLSKARCSEGRLLRSELYAQLSYL